MNKSVLLCGVGGQGTILASKLLAAAAMNKDISVLTAETIGMAQRGGSVVSHLRMGDNLYSPLIGKGKADIIIAFEPAEAVRMLPFVKKGGSVVVNSRPIIPVTAALGNSTYNGQEMIAYLKENVEHVTVVDGDEAFKTLQSPKVLNMVLLGAALRTGELGLAQDDIITAMKQKLPEKFHELNIKALNYTA